jgi:hypothetical protein
MSARPQLLATIDETPRAIGGGVLVEVQTVFAYNSNATGAWIKIYASATTPTGSTVPIWAAFVGQGAVVLPVFIVGAQLWIAASTDMAAGLTAPAADLAGSLTYNIGG